MSFISKSGADEFIIGNPQITFFKAVYRRHTNFYIYSKLTNLLGDTSNNNTSSKTMKCTIDKDGHLLYRCWLEANISGGAAATTDSLHQGSYINWTNNTGHAFLEQCTVSIGGQEIDKHSDCWLDVYNELNDVNQSENIGLNKHNSKASYLKSNTQSPKDIHLVIPLQFWFNRNPGLALPIISLHKNDINFTFTFRAITSLLNHSKYNENDEGRPPTDIAQTDIKFFTEIIYLDSDEQRRFIQNRHEYLIETVNEDTRQMSNRVPINSFSRPTKELIWVIYEANTRESQALTDTYTNRVDALENVLSFGSNLNVCRNDYFNYQVIPGPTGVASQIASVGTNDSLYRGGSNVYGNTNTGLDWFNTCMVSVNGKDRFTTARKATYFRITQPMQYRHRVPKKHIYCYSFSLNPDEYTPSGNVNFSNVTNSELTFGNRINNSTTTQITVFAVSYNIFRIMSGQGSLIYTR